MNPLLQHQLDNNLSTAARWDCYAEHRLNVTELLLGAAGSASRLCVLGAGNCNDLDLGALCVAYREIHLVDLDGDALTNAVARQGVQNASGLLCHGGIDVTGVLEPMASWTPQSTRNPAELADCIEEPTRSVCSRLPGTFDVVASICTLTQLIGAARIIGESHAQFVELFQAIRLGHLRLLADLIAPGGIGLLATDVVSSETSPELPFVAERDLPSLLSRLINARNFFHGVNPVVLEALLQTDLVLHAQVTAVQRLPPWRWNHGARIYAVCAFKVRRRSATERGAAPCALLR